MPWHTAGGARFINMERTHIHLVVFRLGVQRYALPLEVVEHVVRAAEVTPLPNGPAIVIGVINVRGELLPVLNLRLRLRLPEKAISPAECFLIARTRHRRVVLVVDEVSGVIELSAPAIVQPGEIVPGLEHVQGIAKLQDGLLLVHDLESFLSLAEGRTLDVAMAEEVAHGG